MRSKILPPFFLAFLLYGSAGHFALGCGTCLNLRNAFGLSHPQSLQIALATRECLDKGVLDNRDFVAELITGEGRSIRLDKYPARLLVRKWAKQRHMQFEQRLCIHFIFIDTKETCEVTARGNLLLFSEKATADSDAVFVTSKRAFHSVITGRLTARKAIGCGLLLIEGDKSKAATGVLEPGHAWTPAASPPTATKDRSGTPAAESISQVQPTADSMISSNCSE